MEPTTRSSQGPPGTEWLTEARLTLNRLEEMKRTLPDRTPGRRSGIVRRSGTLADDDEDTGASPLSTRPPAVANRVETSSLAVECARPSVGRRTVRFTNLDEEPQGDAIRRSVAPRASILKRTEEDGAALPARLSWTLTTIDEENSPPRTSVRLELLQANTPKPVTARATMTTPGVSARHLPARAAAGPTAPRSTLARARATTAPRPTVMAARPTAASTQRSTHRRATVAVNKPSVGKKRPAVAPVARHTVIPRPTAASSLRRHALPPPQLTCNLPDASAVEVAAADDGKPKAWVLSFPKAATAAAGHATPSKRLAKRLQLRHHAAVGAASPGVPSASPVRLATAAAVEQAAAMQAAPAPKALRHQDEDYVQAVLRHFKQQEPHLIDTDTLDKFLRAQGGSTVPASKLQRLVQAEELLREAGYPT
jgi:hypothetical protein